MAYTRQPAEIELNRLQLRKAEEQKQILDALRDIRRMFANWETTVDKPFSKASILPSQTQGFNPSPSVSPFTPPLPSKPPDPSDFSQSDPISMVKASPEMIEASLLSKRTHKTSTGKVHRKYSCEQIYERMENGLCLFCEELDTPGHYHLRHQRSQIFMTECDDLQISEDNKLVEPVVNLVREEDHAKIVTEEKLPLGENNEHLECKQSQVVSVEFRNDRVWEPGGLSDKLDMLYSTEKYPNHGENYVNTDSTVEQEDSATLIKPSDDVKLSFLLRHSRSHKSILSFSEMILPTSDRVCTEEGRSYCLSQDDRVWEPGGLPAGCDWSEKYRNHDVGVLKLISKLHGTCLQSTVEKVIQPATETLYWILNEKFNLEVSSDLDLQAWTRLEIGGCKFKRKMLLLVKESNYVWERGGLLADKKVSDMNSLFEATEAVMQSSRPVPVAGLRQLVLSDMKSHRRYKCNLCVYTKRMEFSWFKKLHKISVLTSLQKNPEMVILMEKKTQDCRMNAELKIQRIAQEEELVGGLTIYEVAETLEKLTSFKTTKFQDFGSSRSGFIYQTDLLSQVNTIFEEHPDFAVGIIPKNQEVKTAYMNLLLRLDNTLRKSPQSLSVTDLTNAQTELTELTEAGFKLDSLKSKLEEVFLERKKALSDGSWIQQLEERLKKTELTLSDRLKKTELTLSDLKAELDKEKIKSAAAAAKVSSFQFVDYLLKRFFLSCFSIS